LASPLLPDAGSDDQSAEGDASIPDVSSGDDVPSLDAASVDVSSPDALANTTDALATDAIAASDVGPPNDAGTLPDTNVPIDAGPPGPCAETDLVGSWRFEEGSGVVVGDCSGLANDGVWITSAWNPSGVHGGAGHFDGTGWVSVPKNASLEITSALTVAAFVWIDEIPDAGGPAAAGYVVGKTAQPESSGWRIAIEQTGRISFVAKTTAGVGDTYSPVLSVNKWVHVAATFQSGTLALFINGVQVDNYFVGGGATLVNSSMELRFGSRADGTQRLHGDLDDVRVYQRALSPSDIAVLATP
jgi:hypothetical protein